MKIYTLLGTDYIYGKQFIMGSVVETLSNGVIIVCSNFTTPRKEKLMVKVYDPVHAKWGNALMRNEYTENLWNYHRKIQRKKKDNLDCTSMMKHDRKRKCGSGGVRLTPFCGQVTDYECAKNPLHDFRRVWN